MNTIHLTQTEKPCVVYPWDSCKINNKVQTKPIHNNNYLDHMSNFRVKTSPSRYTLTTLACGVPPDVTKNLIEEFCKKGASMVVFDFQGQFFEQSRKMVYDMRQGVFNFSLNKNDRVPYSLALVLDLGGPRIVTGTVLDANTDQYLIELSTNNHVCVTNNNEFRDKCTVDRIYVNNDGILRLKEDDRIYLDYGKIELVIEKVDSEEVCCVINRGGFLGSQRVVHIPGIPIGTTELTAQDRQNIRTGIQLKVDVITVPGVRDAEYIECVKNFVVQEKGKDIDLYATIDNSVGLENIDKILPVVDGVFLHRPNLSMEIGHDRMFRAQKIVLSKCNIAGKPTVVHGEYLRSMDRGTAPTSAEANDVITTVLDGADCVYLDVTKRSAHKAHCVQIASELCRQAEIAIQDKRSEISDKQQYKTNQDPAHSISIECVAVSSMCHVAVIVVITTSGLSARIIARYRPGCPVLAIVRQGKSARKISVWRNLVAVHYIDPVESSWSRDVDNRTRFALKFAKKRDMLNQGDLVLLMSCAKQNAGFTNSMRLFYVSAGDLIET